MGLSTKNFLVVSRERRTTRRRRSRRRGAGTRGRGRQRRRRRRRRQTATAAGIAGGGSIPPCWPEAAQRPPGRRPGGRAYPPPGSERDLKCPLAAAGAGCSDPLPTAAAAARDEQEADCLMTGTCAWLGFSPTKCGTCKRKKQLSSDAPRSVGRSRSAPGGSVTATAAPWPPPLSCSLSPCACCTTLASGPPLRCPPRSAPSSERLFMLGCDCTRFMGPPSGFDIPPPELRCVPSARCARSLVNGFLDGAPLGFAGVDTSCLWKLAAKSRRTLYRSACLWLKNPQDGGCSFPSAIILSSVSFAIAMRSVALGVLDMSVNVQVSV